MYKGFSSGLLGFNGRSLAEDVPPAVSYGYGGISFDIIKESGNDPSAVKELLAKNRLKSSGFGLPVDFRTSKEKFDDDMKKLPSYCAFAQKTGTDISNTWIVPAGDTLDFKENYKLHKERLTRIAKVLEEYGIRFALEFVGPVTSREGRKYEFIYNLGGLMELLHDIGTSNLGLLLDSWHWDLAGHVYEDFKSVPSGKWIIQVHINDGPSGVPAAKQMDLVRELPGATGFIKINDFFKGLRDLDYEGPVFIEPFSDALKAMPFDKAAALATDAMNKVWPE
jgi:sugar phosphate isomerase/epimerase